MGQHRNATPKKAERIRTRAAQPAAEASAVRDPAEVISIAAGREVDKWEIFKQFVENIAKARKIVAEMEQERDERLAGFIAEAAESTLSASPQRTN